ncbi:hypothetical protein LJK88_00785 [Paenibacillus sp. P26]|nr:hypothetical protein LJK88_00785 [Paenibacillus sp. P26]UUZ91197.1 hypothetical protein LJK87_36650 [Paenibacillus sp. P25]
MNKAMKGSPFYRTISKLVLSLYAAGPADFPAIFVSLVSGTDRTFLSLLPSFDNSRLPCENPPFREKAAENIGTLKDFKLLCRTIKVWDKICPFSPYIPNPVSQSGRGQHRNPFRK